MSPEAKKCGVCHKPAGNAPDDVPLLEGAYLDTEGEIQDRPICEDCVNDPKCEAMKCEVCERWFHEGPDAVPYDDVMGTCDDCQIDVCDECLFDHIEDHP